MLCYICSSFVIGQNIAKLFDIHLKENIYYRKIKFHMHTHMEIKTPKLTPAHNTITIHLNNHIKSYPKPNILKNPISCFRITILKLLKCKRPITTWTILKLMSISTHKYSAERLCCMTVAQLNMLYIRFLQVTWKQKGKCPVTASVDVGHAVKMRHRSDMYTFLWKNARIFLRFSAPLPSQTKKKKSLLTSHPKTAPYPLTFRKSLFLRNIKTNGRKQLINLENFIMASAACSGTPDSQFFRISMMQDQNPDW